MKNKMKLIRQKSIATAFVILLGLLFIQACSPEHEQVIEPGQGVFVFDDYEPLSDKTVRVFTYRPEGDVTTMPISVCDARYAQKCR
jgi:hypothetical protein